MRRFIPTFFIILVVSATMLSTTVYGSNAENNTALISGQVMPSVVKLIQGNSLGCGVIINSDGYILTNRHVVDGSNSVDVELYNKKRLKGRVILRDDKYDAAVVAVDYINLPAARLGAEPAQGEEVLAIGAPLGMDLTVVKGIISSSTQKVEGLEYIQTDAPLNPGNSGGPLVNMKGEVVGINTSKLENAEGISFAVPVYNLSYIFDKAGISVNTSLENESFAIKSRVNGRNTAVPDDNNSVSKQVLWLIIGPGAFLIILAAALLIIILIRKRRKAKIHCPVENNIEIILGKKDDTDVDIELK
jgi:S1-C subfamily serine protease